MLRPLPWITTACAVVVALTSCGSGSRSASRPPAADSARTLDLGGVLAARARAREQDILAALPLARRVPRIIRTKQGVQTFLFEGFYSGDELVCVRATPPAEGDTTSVDQYFYDRGRLLGYRHEMRMGGGADTVPDLSVHALFGPDGATLDFQMIVRGEARGVQPPRREALLSMTRRMALEAYEEVRAHPNG